MGWSRIRWTAAVVAMVAVSIGVAVAIHIASNSADQLRRSHADRIELRTQLSEQEEATGLLADQLKALGETPVVEPSHTVPPQIRYVPVPGKDGGDGRPGLPGMPGPNGASVVGPPGESVTGAAGATGPTGPAGKDGSNGVDGAPGSPGKDGSNGANGTDGRGITSLSCTALAPITFTVTYTDGTTAEFSCGAVDPAPSE